MKKIMVLLKTNIIVFSIRFISFIFITFPKSNICQWGWDWNQQKTINTNLTYYEKEIQEDKSYPHTSKLIFNYKKSVSPLQGSRCPGYPSCSTYTLYSIKKFGLFWGLIMGVERIYFRENHDMKLFIHYVPIYLNGRFKVYDLPEANFIFIKKDWRIISPDYFNSLYE